jgi:hypothetical protein
MRITQAEPSVIDLAVPHPEGGFDPEAGLVVSEWQVSGDRFMIGHTANLDDPDAPILVREADIATRPDSGMSYAEGRCTGCTTRSRIALGDGGTMLLLEHQAGCRWFRKLARRAAA